MSIPWLNAAMEEPRTKNGARLMLIVLADRADDFGVSFYGVETLMRRTNLAKSAAHNAIRELVNVGLLRVEYKKGLHGCNLYRLLLTVRNLDSPQSAPCGIQPDTVQNVDSDRAESGPNPSEIHQDPSRPSSAKPQKVSVAELLYPANLDTPEFRTDFAAWMKHRRGTGKKLKEWTVTFQKQLTWLGGFGADAATEMLNQSIRNGWQGLFELKTNGSNGQSVNGHRPSSPTKDALGRIRRP